MMTVNGSRYSVALAFLALLWFAGSARSQPPLGQRLGEYRILDASGRIAPRSLTDASGRTALRPAYAPHWLLRARPMYLSGYAGATYGPQRPRAPLTPTEHLHRPSHFFRAR